MVIALGTKKYGEKEPAPLLILIILYIGSAMVHHSMNQYSLRNFMEVSEKGGRCGTHINIHVDTESPQLEVIFLIGI